MHRNKYETINSGYLWVMVFQVDVFLYTLFPKFVIVEITRCFIIGKTVSMKVVCESEIGGRKLDKNAKKEKEVGL